MEPADSATGRARYRGQLPPGGADTLRRVEALLRDPEPASRGEADDEGCELLKGGPHRTTLRVATDDGSLVVKLFHPPGGGERVRAWLRTDRAIGERRNLGAARRRGLPVPDCHGVLRLHRRRSALLLDDLGAVTPLDAQLDASFDPEADGLAARLRRAGHLLRDALAAGLEHRDLHLGNLVHRATDDALFLLDLHKARFGRRARRAGEVEHRALFGSLPWRDQRGLRAALFEPLDLRDAPRGADVLRDRVLRRRFERCRRSSGPFIVRADGTRQRRADRSDARLPRRQLVLPLDAAIRRFEDAFRLEIRGIPAARARSLRPDRGGSARLLIDGIDALPTLPEPLDEATAARRRAWLQRLADSGLRPADARPPALHRDPRGGALLGPIELRTTEPIRDIP